MKIGGTSTNNIDVWDFADQRPEDADLKGLQEATSNVYGNGHTLVYADMMDAIAQDRPPYIDAKAGRRALEMILAMYQSAACLLYTSAMPSAWRMASCSQASPSGASEKTVSSCPKTSAIFPARHTSG